MRAAGTSWAELMERSYIEVTERSTPGAAAADTSGSSPKGSLSRSEHTTDGGYDDDPAAEPQAQPQWRADRARSAADNITTHAAWDRYLSLIQGRSAFAAIKFNGQDFLRCGSSTTTVLRCRFLMVKTDDLPRQATRDKIQAGLCNVKPDDDACSDSDEAGKGWDYRQWGKAYWWQGTRHPYYNALAAGDIDTMRSMLDFYTRMLPYLLRGVYSLYILYILIYVIFLRLTLGGRPILSALLRWSRLYSNENGQEFERHACLETRCCDFWLTRKDSLFERVSCSTFEKTQLFSQDKVSAV